MEDKYPKVLVISHNPFSNSQNNGKTLSSFFQGWPKNKIAQLYISEMACDTNVCENFYRITDKDALNKAMKRKEKKIGSIVEETPTKKDANKSVIKKLFEKRWPILYLIRNSIWNIAKPWKEKEFLEWLDHYQPQVIFFQSSNVYKLYDMVNFIKERYNSKLILETTDDYVTPKFSLSLFYWIDYFKLISRYKKMALNSKCIFVIGEMMLEEYKRRFPGKYKVALNCVETKDRVIPYADVKNERIKLMYAGNLGLNRWKIIKKIGTCLKEISQENNVKVEFSIYSIIEPNKKIQKQLYIENIMKFKGKLNSNELIEERNVSDILVHVESFDKKNKHVTRLSISTKIPEYLLSNRCILAIGPSNIASIRYIKDNEVGEVIDSLNKKEIKKRLLNIINNREKRNNYISNGIKLANRNHSFKENKEMIQNEIINLFK